MRPIKLEATVGARDSRLAQRGTVHAEFSHGYLRGWSDAIEFMNGLLAAEISEMPDVNAAIADSRKMVAELKAESQRLFADFKAKIAEDLRRVAEAVTGDSPKPVAVGDSVSAAQAINELYEKYRDKRWFLGCAAKESVGKIIIRAKPAVSTADCEWLSVNTIPLTYKGWMVDVDASPESCRMAVLEAVHRVMGNYRDEAWFSEAWATNDNRLLLILKREGFRKFLGVQVLSGVADNIPFVLCFDDERDLISRIKSSTGAGK